MARKRNPKRPSVSIIGSGRLGTALAVALENSGYPVEALVARHRRNAQKASRLLDGKPLTLAENQLEHLPDSKLIIISTPDDAIELVAQKLASVNSQARHRRVVLHTSGALSSIALKPLGTCGFSTGSLHPLLAVSNKRSGAPSWKGVFWCLEGDRTATQLARLIVKDLEGNSFSINPAKKPLYHAAALMVSGHTVALFDIAIEMLVKSGMTPSKARDVLVPLIESTARNLRLNSPAHALAGTFARGDVATVQRHLQALSEVDLSDALAVYKLLGKQSLPLAERIDVDPQALKEIRKLLH
jgi:predicted short-subunit dehydrogenase-like oxidoreductase (DUF2520 family)